MPLKPVRDANDPGYPDFRTFTSDPARFLRKLGATAGMLLVGQALPACDAGLAPRPAGPPAPPPPAAPLERLPGETNAPEPPERLRGDVATPEPPKRAAPPEPSATPPTEPPKDPPPAPAPPDEPPPSIKGRVAEPSPIPGTGDRRPHRA